MVQTTFVLARLVCYQVSRLLLVSTVPQCPPVSPRGLR